MATGCPAKADGDTDLRLDDDDSEGVCTTALCKGCPAKADGDAAAGDGPHAAEDGLDHVATADLEAKPASAGTVSGFVSAAGDNDVDAKSAFFESQIEGLHDAIGILKEGIAMQAEEISQAKDLRHTKSVAERAHPEPAGQRSTL